METLVDSTIYTYPTRHCSLPLSAASYKGQTRCSSQLPATWNMWLFSHLLFSSSPTCSTSVITAALFFPFFSFLLLSTFLPSFPPLPYPLPSFSFFPLSFFTYLYRLFNTFKYQKVPSSLFWWGVTHCIACGICFWPGIEHESLAVKAWSLNCWTSREFPTTGSLFQTRFCHLGKSPNICCHTWLTWKIKSLLR